MAQELNGSRWRRLVREQWNEAGRAWDRWEPFTASFLQPVDPVLLGALDLAPGHRVLDVGCGTGNPALDIARWIGPRGKVVGLDVASPMLDVARRRARLLGLRNVVFRRGDVATHPVRERFDRACSRFGLMFADDVPRSLANVRRALKPGGRAAFAVWGPVEDNPAITLSMKTLKPYLKTPPPDPERSPHPMRLARPGLLERLMRGAGFREVRCARAPTYAAYPDSDTYVAMVLDVVPPLKEVYDGLAPAGRRRVRASLAKEAERYRSGHAVRIPGLAWVVSGRR